MLHQVKEAFRNPKFVLGFCLFVLVLLIAFIYPAVSAFEPLQMVAGGYKAPGTYVSVQDATKVESTSLKIKPVVSLSDSDKETMKTWLTKYGGVEESQIDLNNNEAMIELWNEKYDPDIDMPGAIKAERNSYKAVDKVINTAASDVILAEENEEGALEESKTIGSDEYVSTGEITNKVNFPLGTDNFGADVMTKLGASIQTSLRIGLVAGLIATLIGLTLGLIAGFIGGVVDNIITFITNIFTVIPSFVILVLIANAVSETARGATLTSVIIGLTAWPWTARSVRSQVLSLRNRDHVNLSKLSGHSTARIILTDILPYVASYVVMAMILQISSGILSEAQLSMLGLGPSASTTTTLGIMMNWAQKFAAIGGGYWWAFVPVVISVTLITFSLNLMNTGLDQVFNPTLRD